MTTQATRNPKALFVAAVLSILVWLVAAIIITVIAVNIPNTPLSKILYMASINNDNPAIYSSPYITHLEPAVEILDAIVTPVAMLAAGLFYGWKAKRANALGIVASSVAVGTVLTVALMGTIVAEVLKVAFLQTGKSAVGNIAPLTPTSSAVLAGEFLLWTGSYVLGAWLMSRREKLDTSTLSKTDGSATSLKSKPV